MYGKDLKEFNIGSVLGNIKTDVNLILNHPQVVSTLDTLEVGIDQLFEELGQTKNSIQKDQPEQRPITGGKT